MKENTMILVKRLGLTLLAAVFLVMAGTGCNTTRGAGQDIERAGEKIQDATK